MHTISLLLPVSNTIRTINLELHDKLHERIQEQAKRNNVPTELLLATALADNILSPDSVTRCSDRNL